MASARARLALVALAFAGLGGLGGCSGDDDGGAPADDGGLVADAAAPDAGVWHEGMTLAERPCPPDSFLAAHNFGDGFLAEYCRGCHGQDVPKSMRHGAPLEVNFDTLAEVRQHAARMYARAGDGYTTMPPAGGPDLAARALLGEWLACGAPE